ncbi:hypothetical protein [Quisquiliibacterium transsilvanicum]|uniref:Uncharacterized protein n=1 Tax=Quisquiliibacterium transsilvanicum TaxID=1549638 RepID=A0A7W8HK53_9BURK|nr:hypothetical protein [Quisquiliibacterium transsilvanicum]MBB5273542.1 hypothetical protein [Quisquiliibacterium transsilvanicum]
MSKPIPTTPAGFDTTRIIERPDGFWWQPIEGGREHGPFETLLEAVADMERSDDGWEAGGDESDAVREAEDLLGVPAWVDPDTGHLADDERTRTEDH